MMTPTTLPVVQNGATFSDVMSFFANLGTIIAAGAAVFTLGQWRKTWDLSRNMELAEEALVLAYTVQSAMGWVRSPAGYEGEGRTRKRGEEESEELAHKLDTLFIPIERMMQVADKLNNFRAMRNRYRARFGNESAKPFDAVEAVIKKIRVAANRAARYEREAAKGFAGRDEAARAAAEMLDEVWYEQGDDDPNTKAIDDAVLSLDQKCADIRRSARRWWSLRID